MGGDNVVVAVRVRPFNDREKAKKCQLVVEMPDGKRTGIRDPNKKDDDPKWFTFDYSYWSHDGFKEESNGYSAPADSKYADQRKVFNDLGKGVLDNAWAGYNCSLFAYGQTGSGKSYSMVGTKTNKGIIPIVCEELFNRIGEKKGDDVDCEVFISMFEIYCEKVRDLLTTKQPPKGGLKIREHPKTGFYVEGLSSAPVSSYKEIEGKINEGTKNRTVAATAMNATSSRAHTIVKIKFNQKTKKGGGGTTTKTSEINLVDLAGSERQDKADTEGDRLKEGIVINQSLTTLGRVIKALADQQSSKGKKGGNQVPYRDSALTCLLKNALGGNSKTIMIAALSPADDNYEETLSTLRFADRAKSIKTKAVVNESATERMIRELKEENLRLQQQIGGGGHSSGSEELEALKRQLAENQKEMENLQKTWEQKLAEEAGKHSAIEGHDAALAKKRQCVPHLWNLNEDPALTDVVVHFIPEGEVTVGNKSASPPASIVLNGMAIQPQHAVLHNSGNKKISIEALSGASILINGKEIKGTTELQQNDRILFGGNHLYVFANPTKKGIDKEITYEKAQQEMTQNSGLGVARGGGAKSKEQMILEDELVALMPLVHRANAMAKELGRAVTFEIVLVSPEARGLDKGLTEVVWIKVLNQTDDTHFLWEKNRFMSRYYGMQEMYENKMDGDADWNLPKERDPFYEPPDSEVFIGSAVVFLQSLSFLIDSEEAFPIVDFSGNEMGQLNVSLSPCSVAGKEIRGAFVEQPKELVGKNFAFKVKILSAIGLPKRINKTRCKYRFFGEKEVTTKTISGSNPVYSHENTYTYRPVTDKLVDHLHNSNMYVTVWGSQKGRSDRSSRTSTPASTKSTTTNGSHKAHMRLQRLLDAARSAENTVVSIKAIEEVMQVGRKHYGFGWMANGDDDDKGKKGSGRRRSSSKKKKSTESKEIKVDKPKKTTTSKSRERKKKASEAKD
ncbi:klp-6 [Pristionchus pacificus]|nr:klp-6 [Pristionchus pacificus]|eukprot:PDM63187.1 klp-6 [Pristionchus pacificus]